MNRNLIKVCLVTAITAGLAGCATPQLSSGETSANPPAASDQSALIADQQSRIDSLESE